MRKIFLDTAYLQALVDTRDSLHQSSVAITDELDIFLSVTSEMVLTELDRKSVV